MKQNKFNWQVFFALWLAAIVGIVAVLPYALALQAPLLEKSQLPIPFFGGHRVARSVRDLKISGAEKLKRSRIASSVMVFILGVLLGACSSITMPLTGADRDQVLAYSEAKTDNLVHAINANDYAAFSRDLNATMKNTITADGLVNMRSQVNAKIGNYVSRQVSSVLRTGDNVSVVYAAKFENDDAVTMRVVFETAEPHRISGLWFDSTKLR